MSTAHTTRPARKCITYVIMIHKRGGMHEHRYEDLEKEDVLVRHKEDRCPRYSLPPEEVYLSVEGNDTIIYKEGL